MLKILKNIFYLLLNKIVSRDCVLCKCNTNDYLCNRCSILAKNSSSKISYELGIFACYEYKFPFKHLIRTAKICQDLPAYNAIAKLMIQKINAIIENQQYSLCDAFVFVPNNEFLSRKINHAEFLAREIGKYFNIPIISSIKRVKNTAKQKMSSKKKRFENMENAFLITDIEDFLNIKKITIVDDIYTTGATVSSLKKEILRVNPSLQITTLVFSSHNNSLQRVKI